MLNGKDPWTTIVERTTPTTTTMTTTNAQKDEEHLLESTKDDSTPLESTPLPPPDPILSDLLDTWMISGRGKESIASHLTHVRKTQSSTVFQAAVRQTERAGIAVTDAKRKQTEEEWKDFKRQQDESNQWNDNKNDESTTGRSALSRRGNDPVMGQVDERLETAVNSKVDMTETMQNVIHNNKESTSNQTVVQQQQQQQALEDARNLAASFISQASLEVGTQHTIGGLDHVLDQVKRRIWTPLAAPPQLLAELGMQPVRGLLLYGRPGCGKTLVARTLGQLLSPCRPLTVVSGPEIMDKFVGSSEKNLRRLFEEPPDLYEQYQEYGKALAQAALHVIVLDEFDAIARARGGDGSSSQGDASVARDSVVNQLLAKMDGVNPLAVPTLVIGLTNKRSLIEPALLRSGRFEVQIEVPPPNSVKQRVSILRVHTQAMVQARRVMVQDCVPDETEESELLSYEELLEWLGKETVGFSGAALAGVSRAAASHALERAVQCPNVMDCMVTQDDFSEAVHDIAESMGREDWAEIVEEEQPHLVPYKTIYKPKVPIKATADKADVRALRELYN